MTNREKINKMNNVELAMLLACHCAEHCIYGNSICKDNSCIVGIEAWLSNEVKEDGIKESN